MVVAEGVPGTPSPPLVVLLSRVVQSPGILSSCTAYQDGETFLEYEGGDVAAAQGHLGLLRLRRALLLPVLVRPQGRKESVDDGSSSSSSGGTSRGFSSDDSGSSGSSSSDDRRGEVDESGRDGVIGSGGTGGGREGMMSGDLRFSHRAADWAATQGHLEVVRSVVGGWRGREGGVLISCMPVVFSSIRLSHPYNGGTEHVGLSPGHRFVFVPSWALSLSRKPTVLSTS